MQTAEYFMIFARLKLSYATCKCNCSKHFRMNHKFCITQIILIYFHIDLLKLTFWYQTFQAKFVYTRDDIVATRDIGITFILKQILRRVNILLKI